jgi:four helix bundle protein
MTKVRRFEDFICWQKARALANTIHSLTCHPEFSRDFSLRDQILDAVGSIMHNIAEGCDSGTDPEFIRFLKMARRSSSEVQSELYLALDRKFLSETELRQVYAQADEVKRLVNGLISYLRNNSQTNTNKISEGQTDYLPNADEIENYQTNDYPTNDYQTGD